MNNLPIIKVLGNCLCSKFGDFFVVVIFKQDMCM